MNFTQLFETAYATKNANPYPYQVAFATAKLIPHLVRAPTGAGKTATVILGWLWRLLHGEVLIPRRLVYCLPMRVLVEQTFNEAKAWLDNLGLTGEIGLHLLMGGAERGDWHLRPEQPAILIGTQDMLLSRALNRGYAESRFHWPIDFGLLNNDCLWVFDEPQLMANGVTTSAQLAGLRQSLGTFGDCPTIWMSATLEQTWLDTIDFRGKFPNPPLELTADDYEPTKPLYRRMTAHKTLESLGATSSKDMKSVATEVIRHHVQGTQTLVVANTVERAKAVFKELNKLRKKSESPVLLLIHSRFRPIERNALNEMLQNSAPGDRIIVATQVVEAGVDISARTLITELSPWSSIVQRTGRCNRTGNDGPGAVYWIEVGDDEKAARPYTVEDLSVARRLLSLLEGKDVSPKALEDFKQEQQFKLPFEHKHVLRRRDLVDLFDTAPDLSGNDIDISRFVRSDDPDTDVQVFWRDEEPSNQWPSDERRRQVVRREELCNVPISSFKKEFLEAGRTAFRFDHLEGEWRLVSKRDSAAVMPGQVFWIPADQGGYDAELGWEPSVQRVANTLLMSLPAQAPARGSARPEGFYDSDEWSHREWQTIAEHTNDVVAELNQMLACLRPLALVHDEHQMLRMAARWHDWGKAHPVFQSGVCEEILDPRSAELPDEERLKTRRPFKWQGNSQIAKAPDEFWSSYSRTLTTSRSHKVKRFRHELASALAIIEVLRLGIAPAEWSDLAADERDLAIYLIASHHGKVRLSIRAMPNEKPIPGNPVQLFAAGIWDEDELPSVDIGLPQPTPEIKLSLAPMKFGSERSWSALVLKLRDRLGPFKLAYFEAIMRAADCRASAQFDEKQESDDA